MERTGFKGRHMEGPGLKVDIWRMEDRKVNIRLHGKGYSKLPWRKAGQPRHLVDVVDSAQ